MYRRILSAGPSLTVVGSLGLAAASAAAANGGGTVCESTADRMYKACLFDVSDDLHTGLANCQNISHRRAERRECRQEVRGVRNEEVELCGDIREARKDVCELLGEYLAPEKNTRLAGRAGGPPADYTELKTFVADRPGHDRRYAIDAGKIRRDLGWEPRLGFDEGMARTVRWYLDNGQWCDDVQSGNYRRERLGLTAGKE